MPTITHEFTASGAVEVDEMVRAVQRVANASRGRRAYPPVDTPALTAAMNGVGPASESQWFDYLSPGDALRVVWLNHALRTEGTPEDVRVAVSAALVEIRRVAEERMTDEPKSS